MIHTADKREKKISFLCCVSTVKKKMSNQLLGWSFSAHIMIFKIVLVDSDTGF